jgi:DNA-binding NarL/FixJ family response regulator
MSPGVLIGRDAEVARLRAWVRQAVFGRGQAVVIEGEPGIGKSMLMDVVAAECAQLGVRLLRGTAEEMEQQVPFSAVASCLAADPETPPVVTALLRGEDGQERQDADPSDVRSVASREFAVTEAIQDLIEQWCSTGPVALLLDDLQWADPASFLVLHRLGRTIGQVPLLMVVASRPVPRTDELERLLRSLHSRGSTSISLGPLDAPAVAGLVGNLAGGQPGPELLDLVAGAAGNPLYLTELVAALRREGRIKPDGDLVELRDNGPDPVPQSLPGAIMRRLDFLSREARDVLEVAAALGPGLRLGELSTILDTPASELLTVVREAVAAGLLTDSGENLVFRHSLIRQALAENVPATVRGALHLQAGRALATSGAQVDRVAQYLVAGDGADAWVLDWLVDNGDSLVGRSPMLALDLLGRALAHTGADDDRVPVLRYQLARSLLWAGRPVEAERVARAGLATDQDAARHSPLRWLLAQAYLQQGRLRDAQYIAEETLAHVRLTPPEAARFEYFAGQARLTRGERDLPREEALAEAMIARGDPVSKAYGLYYLAGVRYLQERAADSLDLLDRAARAFGTPEAQPDWDVPMQMYRAYLLVELDRPADAERAFESGLRQSERHASFYLSWYHLGKSRLLFLTGRWDDALAEIQAGLDTLDTLAKTRGMGTQRGLRAQAAIIAIHRADRAVTAAVAKEPYVPIRGLFYDSLGRWAQALAWEAQGQLEQALISLFDFWAQDADSRLQRGLHYLCPDIARLAVMVGDTDRARNVAAEAATLLARQPTATLRGIHAYCHGSAEADLDLLRTAADSFAQAGRVLYEAYAHEGAAVVLAARGDTAEARQELATALDRYERLDASWDAARARARLREAGVRSRKPVLAHRAKTGWDALTDTERQVAELVAEGHSNPDIAARMFISRRTVQSHVSSILTKLNVTSRVELAVTASRRGPT